MLERLNEPSTLNVTLLTPQTTDARPITGAPSSSGVTVIEPSSNPVARRVENVTTPTLGNSASVTPSSVLHTEHVGTPLPPTDSPSDEVTDIFDQTLADVELEEATITTEELVADKDASIQENLSHQIAGIKSNNQGFKNFEIRAELPKDNEFYNFSTFKGAPPDNLDLCSMDCNFIVSCEDESGNIKEFVLTRTIYTNIENTGDENRQHALGVMVAYKESVVSIVDHFVLKNPSTVFKPDQKAALIAAKSLTIQADVKGERQELTMKTITMGGITFQPAQMQEISNKFGEITNYWKNHSNSEENNSVGEGRVVTDRHGNRGGRANIKVNNKYTTLEDRFQHNSTNLEGYLKKLPNYINKKQGKFDLIAEKILNKSVDEDAIKEAENIKAEFKKALNNYDNLQAKQKPIPDSLKEQLRDLKQQHENVSCQIMGEQQNLREDIGYLNHLHEQLKGKIEGLKEEKEKLCQTPQDRTSNSGLIKELNKLHRELSNKINDNPAMLRKLEKQLEAYNPGTLELPEDLNASDVELELEEVLDRQQNTELTTEESEDIEETEQVHIEEREDINQTTRVQEEELSDEEDDVSSLLTQTTTPEQEVIDDFLNDNETKTT